MYGKQLSSEARQKISKALKGMTAWNKGKTMSDEQKNKISLPLKGRQSWNKGKTPNEEYRLKLSINSGNARPVLCVELNKEFRSCVEAGKYINRRQVLLMTAVGGVSRKQQVVTIGNMYYYYEKSLKTLFNV